MTSTKDDKHNKSQPREFLLASSLLGVLPSLGDCDNVVSVLVNFVFRSSSFCNVNYSDNHIVRQNAPYHMTSSD